MSYLEIDYKTKESFFEALLFFKQANYTQKVDFMKKHWGNIVTTTTINYPDNCSITIRFDEKNKYHFDFQCSEISFIEFEKFLPQYAEVLISSSIDGAMREFEELKDLTLKEMEDENEDAIPVDDNEQIISAEDALDNTYLNVYNGINIIKKQ